jgi:proteasome lid subunit RPN8/RPN11
MGRSGLERILEEGRSHYPYECCGFLVGRWEDGRKEVLEVRPAPNARADSPQNRYLIPPEIYLRVEKELREKDLEVVGFYHSHPDVEARPSAFDKEHAWPGYSYVIVSVRAGAPRETRSWVLSEDRQAFEEETLSVEEGSRAPSQNP